MAFIFTPENLIANLEKLGPWSAYGMASCALKHYFPHEYNEDGYCEIEREVELMSSLNCDSWHDVIKKYASEVGYEGEFNTEYVNEF